jgi:hypothetical protein
VILDLLDSDPRRNALVSATSTSPTGYSAQASRLTSDSLREFDFELSVESAAGGPSGVTYNVAPAWSASVDHYSASYRLYTFQPVTAHVLPPSLQPQPTEVNIAECMGVLRLQWGHDATCSTPVSVNSSYMYWGGTSGPGRAIGADHYYYVRGGTSGTSTLQYTIGSSEYNDRITHRTAVQWSAACDEVVTICTPIPEASELGAVQGPWHVAGEESTRSRRALATLGPENNHRYGWSLIEALPSEPDRWWTLPNMVPGSYALRGQGWLRRGHEHVYYETPGIRSLTVTAGQTIRATLPVDGAERDALVMHPAYMHGSIRLADPYVVSQPGAESSLQALFFEADFDRNNDGLQDSNFFVGGRVSTALRARAAGYQGYSAIDAGHSATSFPGRFNPGTGELSSSYEHVLPNLYDLSASWRQELLRLGFWSVGTYTFKTRPGEYDPVRFRHGALSLTQRQNASALLGPGDTHRVDHEYCFNEVQLHYSTADAVFYNPTANISGSFRGTDWRGQSADYTASGSFTGIPAAIGIPQSEAITYAQSSGAVSFPLPQGTFTIKPGASIVHPDGSVNNATFRSIQLTLGCGQRLKLVPPLSVMVNPAATCAESSATTITGTVQSNPATVDRIWYRVNKGPEVTLCTSCGLDPAFSFPVTLDPCENTIEVFAYTAGMPEPASGFVQLVWDDPADGPSCTDATCVNRPPVARCDNLVLAADDTCTACGSIDGGSYDPDGDPITCVESTTCPYALGRNRVTLTCTDSHGAVGSCEGTVNVVDRTAPVIECPAGPVLECIEGGAMATYEAYASDSCGTVTTTCEPANGSWFGLGETEVECIARDEASNAARCTIPVTVVDTTGPEITCPDTIIAECTDGGAAEITPLPAQVADACTTAQVVSAPGPGSYPVGVTTVEYVAEDEHGNQSSCTASIIVTDNAAPVVQVPVTAVLWPPSHDMREVSLADCGVAVADVCSGGPAEAVNLAITCVSADEPVSTPGSGSPSGADIEWVDDTRVRLRAEREGRGDGRVYRIHFEARDGAGNVTPAVCEVHVPHDQSEASAPAVDSGAAYQVCR